MLSQITVLEAGSFAYVPAPMLMSVQDAARGVGIEPSCRKPASEARLMDLRG